MLIVCPEQCQLASFQICKWMRAVENFNMGHMCRPNAEREHRLSISQWTLNWSQVESSCVKLSQVESSWVKSCIVYFVIALIFHFIAHCLDYRIHKYFAAQRVSIWSIRAPKQPKLNARRETEGSVKFLVLVGGTQKLNWEWQTQQKKTE